MLKLAERLVFLLQKKLRVAGEISEKIERIVDK